MVAQVVHVDLNVGFFNVLVNGTEHSISLVGEEYAPTVGDKVFVFFEYPSADVENGPHPSDLEYTVKAIW